MDGTLCYEGPLLQVLYHHLTVDREPKGSLSTVRISSNIISSNNLGKLPLFTTCCCRNLSRRCLWKSNSVNAGKFGLTTLSTNSAYCRISSSQLRPSRCCCFTKWSITSLNWLAAWVVLVAILRGSRQANRRANVYPIGIFSMILLMKALTNAASSFRKQSNVPSLISFFRSTSFVDAPAR